LAGKTNIVIARAQITGKLPLFSIQQNPGKNAVFPVLLLMAALLDILRIKITIYLHCAVLGFFSIRHRKCCENPWSTKMLSA
jgi:hypothetical protein